MVTETTSQSDGNTSFLRAARAGHLDKVLEQLRNNVDINTSNANGLNALHLASKDGHVHVVTELLKRGANVDSATKKGNTALHIASLAGQEEVVRLLVEHGASVNVQSQNGFTPLYMAAQENHDNVVKYLLANGANQSLATEDGFTPLAVAMQQGHDKVVAVLLENDTRGKVRLPALHIAAKKDDCKAAALLLQNEHNPDVTSKSGFTPLHIASHYGNEGIANLLLNKGADVNYAAKHNITPLHVAAKWGKSNMVSLLLEKGANIESKTRDGLTPLHCAARSGHEQVVDMLLERGAPISSKTKNGLAPLHMASQGDHVDAARILLYHRAPVDEVTVDYLTALHVAAHCGHARVAKLLLDRKADPNARALNGFTPLHIACKKNRIKVVELLLKHGASIEATTESGLTPLHVASFMGCMNIVIYLLQNEANPDVPTVRGETPLHLAARANQTDIIRILLRNGAQVDARAREQQTPLHIAARLGNVDIVMLLLQHGAAVDCTTKDLYSALHIAAKEGQDEVAAVLLENGASVTATTKKGFTPLHLAAKYGNMKVARLLLQRDAPVDAQGKNGVTPLHVASHYDHQNVALLLLDKGASPHATAKNGHTPLHIAAKKNQMDIATTLLEYGAKANSESKAGFTPLHLSSQEGHVDMSSLLIDHQADTNHKAKNGLTPIHLCSQEDRVNVASILVKNGAEVDTTTKAGYTPLHVACHFGQLGMVRFLLNSTARVDSTTAVGYTPLHQAAQQGHCAIVNTLLEHGAPPNATTNQGQTAMSIAQKLGYISVVETLKGVTETATITPLGEEKYKVVSPETMQETFMSDSEDEGGEDTLLSEQPYRYLTVDEMKSLGDDSLPIDVRQDERQDSNRECMSAVDDTISPQHLKEAYSQFTTLDNIDIARHPLHVGFLVSFLVDARGGAMRGCRHSGVRVIVPPRRASMPMRVTCRYLRRDKLTHPPPLMEGEALASRILELGPVGAKFLGPVMIEVPHFGSLRGKEREIVILRSDNGETWREHTVDCSEEAVQDVLNHSFDKEDLAQLEESSRTTRILTSDFPHYFAVVTRVRQEVHAIGPEGGMVSSNVVPQVQAVFPQGALTKKIKVGLQAQPIPAELAAKLLGNRVAVSPIVTVEPRRRKFHKPITLTIPKPQAANKGMINQYSGDAPTLRLLCSITGGTTRAQWEDVTGSTPFTFVNDCVSFTTTVSARFWLMDCRNVGDATKMATELYREAIHVPFMAKFVVFAKRVDPLEARLRIFCMTDDKEDKTLEHQEHFTEVAKSRDVEVLEGKTQYIEFAGNLVPVTKSGEQLQLGFRAFRENRLPFTGRVKDPHADPVGRTLFMREARLPKGEPPQQPICVLNIVLPDDIIPEAPISEHELHKYSFTQDSRGLESYQRVDLRLSDVSNLLGEDWVRLAHELAVSPSDINRLKTEHPQSSAQQGLAMLRLWLTQAGNKAQASTLESALQKIGRDDIVQQCVFNVDHSGVQLLKDESRDASLRRSIPYSDKDIMKDSESVEDLSRTQFRKKKKDDKEERKYEAEEKEVEEVKKSVSERRQEIEKRLSLEKPIIHKTETIIDKIGAEKIEDISEKEIAEEKRVSSPEEDEPSELSFEQKRLSFEQGKRVIEMKPDKTTMKEVKERADERFLAEERKAAEALQEKKALIDETSISFEEKRKSFEKTEKEEKIKEEKLKEKKEESKKEDARRDSALFEGVSQGLVRLDAAFTAAPQVQDLLSPKASKTPPPSPAEFKDLTGTVAWTDDTSAAVPSNVDQSQDWAEKGRPDSTIDASNKEVSQDVTRDHRTPDADIILPKPSPRPTKQDTQDEIIDSQKSNENIPDYSVRKKFWEQMSSGSQDSQRSQDFNAPVPKPRSSIVSSVPFLKSEAESDTETTATTLSDSTVRIKGFQQDAVSKQSFTGSSDTSDKEEVSEAEATDKMNVLSSVLTTSKTVVSHTTDESKIDKSLTEAAESSDSETEYITKLGEETLAFENTGFVPDDIDSNKDVSLSESIPHKVEISEVSTPVSTTRKSHYERSVSLPTEDITDTSVNSVKARKRFFEAQIKKEMVVDQLMTQLEEESSPEHKSFHHKPSDAPTSDPEMVSRQIHSHIFSHELEEQIESLVPENKLISEQNKESKETGQHSVKETFSTFDIVDAKKCVKRTDSITYEAEVVQVEPFSKEEMQESNNYLDKKPENDTFKSNNQVDQSYSDCFSSKTQLDDQTIDFNGIVSEPENRFSEEMAELIKYRSDSISKPSDSLEVHIDKSEIEESEKEMEIDEELKQLEAGLMQTSKSVYEYHDDERLPEITITQSSKQRPDSYSQGESEDTQSESDITPEDLREKEGISKLNDWDQDIIVLPVEIVEKNEVREAQISKSPRVHTPEEHIPDTVWEVPIQQEPETNDQEIVEDIPIGKQPIFEKDEEESQRSLTESCEMKSQIFQIQEPTANQRLSDNESSLTESALDLKSHEQSFECKLTEEEARVIAQEIVENIEIEISKRPELMTDVIDENIVSETVKNIGNSEVSDYIKRLTGKEDLEVRLIESVLAKKQREQIIKLSRTDTTTSSMEITDEDLRSSGVETDNSPLESQGSRLCPVEDQGEDYSTDDILSQEKDLDDDIEKIKEKEVLEKTLAEVKESLEAAQDELIEEQKKKKEVHKKPSPSEFEFKTLALERFSDEYIEECHVEETSAVLDLKNIKENELHTEIIDVSIKESGDKKGGSNLYMTENQQIIKTEDKETVLDSSEAIYENKMMTKTNTEVYDTILKKEGDIEVKYTEKGSTSVLDKDQKISELKSSQNSSVSSLGSTVTKNFEASEKEKEISEESFEYGSLKEEWSNEHHIKIEKEKKEGRKVENLEDFAIVKEEITIQLDESGLKKEITSERKSTKSVLQFKEEFSTESRIQTADCKVDALEGQLIFQDSSKLDLDSIEKEGSNLIITSHKQEIKRTLSEESQRSSQDESIKSHTGIEGGISSSSSSGKKEDLEALHTLGQPDVVLRKRKTDKPSSHKRADRRSGTDYEPYSSSGESHYHSFEQNSESIRTPSRPCSSDIDALVAGVGTTGSSEYESAISHEVSGRSLTSYEYHTAVSSLSSRESMKSLDSESSGNLASVEISSEASETLVPSAMELDSDMDGLVMHMVDEESFSKNKSVLEPYDRDIPHHVIKGESPPRIPAIPDVRYCGQSASLDISSEGGVSEEDGETSLSGSREEDILDKSTKMKRSHEMTFQPEPRAITFENASSESFSNEEKYGSSLDDTVSVFSASSTSDTAAVLTIIEKSKTDSEKMDCSANSDQLSLTVSGTSEQISLSSVCDDSGIQQNVSHETIATQSLAQDAQVESVLLMTSSVYNNGIQSVSTQVTSQSEIPPTKTDEIFEDGYTCSNGPTQVEYNAEYDDVKEIRKRPGHRRSESTSFKPSMIPIFKKKEAVEMNVQKSGLELNDDAAESDKYEESKSLTLKEDRNDEKKDVDEAEKVYEESYQTEADQGFHRDMREARQALEDMSSLEEECEEIQNIEERIPGITKSDLESDQRAISSECLDDRPDSELSELLKQCSGEICSEDPIERPKTPEPSEDIEIKDDTPELSSEAQTSVTELELEYSGAFSRTQEYEAHISPIREKDTTLWEHPTSDHEEELAEAEAAFQMVPHVTPHLSGVPLPDTIIEDPIAEKRELETKEASLKEEICKRAARVEATSPGFIPDITITQHMTPLIDRGFHYPDLELEESNAKTSAPQTPASISSRASSETETDQGREYVLGDDVCDDFIQEEPDLGESSVTTEEKTVFESKDDFQERGSATDSPNSDSFEMLEKPDITDEFVIIEEVGKEAHEQDREGKSMAIGKKRVVKKVDDTDEVVVSPPAPVTRMTEIKFYPEGGAAFPFESDSPPTNMDGTQSGEGTSQEGSPPSDIEHEYESEVEAGKKWIEMQFQGDQATAVYGYELDYERGPLEDIKEEPDLENNSSRFGSLGSQVSQSAGSFGSMKESFSSTPDYDVLAGRKYFTRSGEHDDVSMSSLQEFERLENLIAMEINRNKSSGSQDSLNSSGNSKRHTGSGKSGGDDVSLASLKEFEGLEHACIEAAKIELKAKEEEAALLSEIEEGHESQASESESCETISASVLKGCDSDEDDYEKRMFEIDEIIRQAQTNVERFIDIKEKDSLTESSIIEKTESMGRGDSIEEVSKIPDLDLDQPLHSLATASTLGHFDSVNTVQQWKSKENEVTTSISSKHHSENLTTSTDSLEIKPVSERDIMSASTDSIEFQAQQKKVKSKDIMTDSIEVVGDKTSILTSTDSLETDPPKYFSDSMDEEDGGHTAGLHDRSSSSGRDGDFSFSGKDEYLEQNRMPPPRSDLLLGSTDSLEPSSSTATHATYHCETDSVMSSSFTSGGSNTMMSSTETIDTGMRTAVWFDDNKPYVTEVIEPCEEGDGFVHTIHRTVEMPPEIHNVTFRGPNADKALKEYIDQFGPGQDVTETQEMDAAGNIHTMRVIQKRVVIKPDEFKGSTRLSEAELDEYLKQSHEQRDEMGDFYRGTHIHSSSSQQSFSHEITTSHHVPRPSKQQLTSTQVKGETAGEEVEGAPSPANSRETDEALLDLAAGLQDNKGTSSGVGPSNSK